MSETKPLVSVIIPTYNGSKRIAKTLEAMINQDYENIEIIVVDDVSTDNTVEVCQNVLENSGRIFNIIKRTKNGRQSASRNTGLNAANGKYVIFIDHDDLAEKNFVSALCNETTTKNVEMAFCNFKFFYEDDLTTKNNEQLSGKSFSTPESFIKAWANNEFIIWGAWNFIFNKEFLNKNHLCFNERCYICEDREFILKAMAFSSGISFIDSPLYTYIRYSEQQSQIDKANRYDYKTFQQAVLAMWRIGRCILRHTNESFLFIV